MAKKSQKKNNKKIEVLEKTSQEITNEVLEETSNQIQDEVVNEVPTEIQEETVTEVLDQDQNELTEETLTEVEPTEVEETETEIQEEVQEDPQPENAEEPTAEVENEIKPSDILGSKMGFADYMANSNFIEETLAKYKKTDNKAIVKYAQLTQNSDTLNEILASDLVHDSEKAPFISWTVVNPKDNLLRAVESINRFATKGFGIFVFKAFDNEGKIDFECLVKPELKEKRKRSPKNNETPTALGQLAYWNKYSEVCDTMGEGDYQIEPASQHFQNIRINKSGVYLKQTIGLQKKTYIACELFISSKKEIFYDLESHKAEIESELGTLEWSCKEQNTSAYIRKTIPMDLHNTDIHETAAKQHVELAIEMNRVFSKFLDK